MQQPQHALTRPQTLHPLPTGQTVALSNITVTTTAVPPFTTTAPQMQQQETEILSPYLIPRNKPHAGPLRAPYRRANLLLLGFPPTLQPDVFRTRLSSSGVVMR